MQTGTERDLRTYTAHKIDGGFVGLYSFEERNGWVRLADGKHSTNWNAVPNWKSELESIYGETNLRLAMHTGCICGLGNWESLNCPKHGLDAPKGATINEPDTAL